MQSDLFGHVVRVWLLAILDVTCNIFKCPGELTVEVPALPPQVSTVPGDCQAPQGRGQAGLNGRSAAPATMPRQLAARLTHGG